MKATIIIWDCVRADAIDQDTTPFFLSLPGWRFTRAYANAPWTVPSVVSLLTGLPVSEHGCDIPGVRRHLGKKRVDKPRVPLPAICYCGENPVLRSHLQVFNALGSACNVQLMCWMNAHEPLHPSKAALRAEGIDFNNLKYTRWDNKWNEAERKYKRAVYQAAVRDLDSRLEALWPEIRGSIVVVVADHGEEFWDHAELERQNYQDPRGIHGMGHGHTLFEELLRVPLLVYAPGAPRVVIDHPYPLCATRAALQVLEDGLEPSWAWDWPIVAGGIAYGWRKQAVIDGTRKIVTSDGPEPGMEFELPDEQHWHAPGYTAEEEAEIERHLAELGYI